MSVSTLGLDSSWRDYIGNWSSFVEPLMAPLEQSKCHAIRYALIPDILNQVIPVTGKIEYNFFLVPGSVIWGMWPAFGSQAFQLTDVSMGHEFFQEPMTSSLMAPTNANGGNSFPGFTLLPTPHPVVGDGLFTLEVWGTPGDPFFMLLGVAEVTNCPVR